MVCFFMWNHSIEHACFYVYVYTYTDLLTKNNIYKVIDAKSRKIRAVKETNKFRIINFMAVISFSSSDIVIYKIHKMCCNFVNGRYTKRIKIKKIISCLEKYLWKRGKEAKTIVLGIE